MILSALLEKKGQALNSYIKSEIDCKELNNVIDVLCESLHFSLEPIQTIYDIYQNQSLYLTPPPIFIKTTEYLIHTQGLSAILPLMSNQKNINNLMNVAIRLEDYELLNFMTHQVSLDNKLCFFNICLTHPNEKLLQIVDSSLWKDKNLLALSDCLSFIHSISFKGYAKYFEVVKKYFTLSMCENIDWYKQFVENIHPANGGDYDYYFKCLEFLTTLSDKKTAEKIILVFFEINDLIDKNHHEFRSYLEEFTKKLPLDLIVKAIHVSECPNVRHELDRIRAQKENKQFNANIKNTNKEVMKNIKI